VEPAAIKAIFFDVFGTVVDWRSSIIREAEQLGRGLGVVKDWPAFADDWRAGYHAGMRRVNAGLDDWKTVDQIHRECLEALCEQYGITGLSEPQLATFNCAWHRLDPWPDAVDGLKRLKAGYVIAPLSNGNMALLTNLSKFAGLPWDCVLSSELVGRYKPDPKVYQAAATMLGLEPGEVLMVAAHGSDLRGATAGGLGTAYVSRPDELGPQRPYAPEDSREFDFHAIDFKNLADQLGRSVP